MALLLRRLRRWQWRQTALASLAGLGTILFSLVAVNLFFSGFHTANYLAAGHSSANPNALYMISAGANDLFWMQSQQTSLTPQQLLETYMRPWAATLAAGVATLQADGARSIVVFNLNEYARLVGANGQLTDANRVSSEESLTFWGAIGSSRGVNVGF